MGFALAHGSGAGVDGIGVMELKRMTTDFLSEKYPLRATPECGDGGNPELQRADWNGTFPTFLGYVF
jgi:hypothetical protein